MSLHKPLIVCNNPPEFPAACGFNELMLLANNLVYDLILISTFLATAAFAWAGIKLLTSGGKESARDEAKTIFRKVIIGYLWILAAWVIIYTISSVLLDPDYTNLLKQTQ